MSDAQATFIYRFARDLRLDDHAGLAAAAAQGAIVPVLVVDRDAHRRAARSPRRAAVFCAAIAALDGELRARGSRLLIRRGPAARALRQIARETGARGVAWSAGYEAMDVRADAALQSQLEEAGLIAQLVHDAPAVPPDETAAVRSAGAGGYRAFAPYYDVWKSIEVGSYEAPVLQRFADVDVASEALPLPSEFGGSDAELPEVGAAAARARLTRFLTTSAAQYAVAMNVPADDRTSHLSVDLSFGTIAARTVVRATRRRAEDPLLLSEERLSLRLFLRSLAQRDFFLQLAWFNPQTQDAPLQEKMRGFPFVRGGRELDAWLHGQTGFPLVDAGMRQLRATGWMHPRVRSVCASFLCFDLRVDWRQGRDAWDALLVEDDAALATGNWQWIAGVGADMAQYPRIYNPQRQRQRFDPQGAYVKRWVNELAHVAVSEWGPGDGDGQLALPLFGQNAYARAVVDHDGAARAFLQDYRRFSREPESSRRSNR